jgi:FxsC-like protein
MNTTVPETDRRGMYFFLSYARVPIEEPDPDDLVGSFFADLSARVQHRARDVDPLEAGAYDRAYGMESDLDHAIAHDLGRAEVLVPLYSPRYIIEDSWPWVERQAFQGRLDTVDRDTTGHIQPVRWMPLPPGVSPPVDGVRDLAPDIPHYAEYGLGRLCDLPQHKRLYQRIVDRLAKRIVAVAEGSPIGPSENDPTLSGPRPAPDAADFVVAVLALTSDTRPKGRDANGYGAVVQEWAPLVRARPVPIARQVANVAERLNLGTSIVNFREGEDAIAQRPSVLLIDPWLLAVDGGEDTIRRAAAKLPEWATAIVVSDIEDTQHGRRATQLHNDALVMLGPTSGHRLDIQRAEQFDTMIPAAIMHARKRFLRNMPRLHPPKRRLGVAPPRQRRPEGN